MAIRNSADFLRYDALVFGQSDTTAPQQATQRQPTENSGIIIAPKKPRGRQQSPLRASTSKVEETTSEEGICGGSLIRDYRI